MPAPQAAGDEDPTAATTGVVAVVVAFLLQPSDPQPVVAAAAVGVAETTTTTLDVDAGSHGVVRVTVAGSVPVAGPQPPGQTVVKVVIGTEGAG